MKKGIHPDNYRPVVFQDLNDNSTILTRSTVATDETITLDGVEYPLVKVHISSSSHPFFTGEERIVDVEGRVDKFKARQAAAQTAREAKAARKPKAPKKMRIDETTKLGAKTPKPKADHQAKPAASVE
ncbi:MAG TPA: type B 50S ribosomal protein L31 [Candidatus Saccharimonadales bacterium]|nr:type B 50S ribosomal protein L31 [Candidatus Saccharimonadales bacterium]